MSVLDEEKSDIERLFRFCTQNSFGSVSKQELDIFLFGLFKKREFIRGDNSWDIACELKISKSKAQKYLYENELRENKANEINNKLKAELSKIPTIEKDGILSLMIDSPYMRDFIRNELRKANFFSDRSFASDVVKMPVEGYLFLLEKYNNDQYKKFNHEELIKALMDVPSEFLGMQITKIFGESAVKIAEKGIGYVIKNFISERKK